MEKPSAITDPGDTAKIEKLGVLREEQAKALQVNKDSESQWQKFRSEYSTLRGRLVTLPDKVRHDVMVPLGPKAVVPGRLVKTNEIMVLLGDNWFATRSAKQAIEICDRRIKQCDDMLEKLHKERELMSSWQTETEKMQNEVMGDGETMNITEQCTEEEDMAWRAQHRERVRQHYQQRAAVRDAEQCSDADRELWDRLEELELQEHMHEELRRMKVGKQEVESDDEDEEEEQEAEKEEEENNWEEIDENEDENNEHVRDVTGTLTLDTGHKRSETTSPRRRVSFANEPDMTELNEEICVMEIKEEVCEPLKIYIKHSDNYFEDTVRENGDIKSPADIYKLFPQCFVQPSLKSILKNRSVSLPSAFDPESDSPSRMRWLMQPDSVPIINIEPDQGDGNVVMWNAGKEKSMEEEEDVFAPAVSDVIVERSEPSTPVEEPTTSSSRPVSRFRAARQVAHK